MSTIIRTGICSYGMSGKLFHAPFIEAHPGFELTAIVERSKDESRKKYPHSKLYRSVNELLGDKTIELIIVNTPVQTHYDYARQAMLNGKNVIVEKPFTVSSREAEELTAIAREKNVSLFVYQNRRYDGDYNAVKEVLKKNLLGEIKEVEIRFDRFRPELSGKLHKETKIPGAGTTYDLGAHLIDQSLQLFGWPQALFADLMAMRDGSPVDDYFEILLYYPSFRVRLKGSCFVKQPVAEFIFHGSKGSFLQQRSDAQEQQLLKDVIPSQQSWCPPPPEPDGLLVTEKDGKTIREALTSTPGNYMGYFDDVYKTLTKQAPNPVPGEDGIKIMRILEATLLSSAEKRIINL
ncbi:MAG: oxidoreductase [Chitinophagaceae bacterium]|nr:oxidoreductase [Chitinophagaceae bacterium]